ncbi:MAG: hypothetical protein FJ267_20105 [Planctomycetes bacterium]|nr:hypothetical protein [Planctomycetota bacterium]
MTANELQQNHRSTTKKSIFSRCTTVSVDIKAPVEKIWKFLTDARNFTSWNSTLIELTGEISPKGKIQLRSKLAADLKKVAEETR